VFERLKTPEELYNLKLGAALKMEHTVLEMLVANTKAARSSEVADLFRHHHDETRRQIANLAKVFAAFGWDIQASPCPAIEGIAKERKANVRKSRASVVDDVLLAGAAETEHHEIAVYENLITHAHAMGKGDVVELLKQNLEQEQHTLAEVQQAAERAAAASSGAPLP
jgi:ferritin-like metal-binding protein YciE